MYGMGEWISVENVIYIEVINGHFFAHPKLETRRIWQFRPGLKDAVCCNGHAPETGFSGAIEMTHVKRLFVLLLVFAMVFAYILYDFGQGNVPLTKRIAAFAKKAKKLKAPSSRDTDGADRGFPNVHTRRTKSNSNFNHVDASRTGEHSTDLEQITETELPAEDDSRPDDRKERREPQSGDGMYSSKYRGVDIGDGFAEGEERWKGSVDRDFSELNEEGDNIGQLTVRTGEESKLKRRLPNAIIIGVKKGGTRALLEILKIHPSVRASSREAHFFDRDENYELGLEWYRDQMPLSLPEQVTMEKSPSYFVTNGVPDRVYQMSPTVKLLVIVRDPTQRAVSDYTQSLFKHPDNPPFEELVLVDAQKGIVNGNWSKITIGRYAKHLTRWLKSFPQSQIHFVSGEELVKNPAAEIKLVEKFLGLKPYITQDNFYFNKTKGFFCFVGKKNDFGRVRDDAHCMGSSKGRKHPPVREHVLKIVQQYFRPHNVAFYNMVKRDFNWS